MWQSSLCPIRFVHLSTLALIRRGGLSHSSYAFIRAPLSSTVKIQAAIFPMGIVSKSTQ